MLDKFLEVVLNTTGKIASLRMNKEYFVKNNIEELWTWYEEASKAYQGYDNRSIIFMLRNGITEPPKCIVCEENAAIQFYMAKGKVSEYCSKKCAESSKERAKKMSDTKKAWNEEKKAEVQKKREESMVERYGYAYNSFGVSKSGKAHNRLDLPVEEIYYEYHVLKKSMVDIADKNSCDYDTIRTRLTEKGSKIRRNSRYSREEVAIKDFIESLGISVVSNTWEIITNKEIDIYAPEFKFAIEMDGLTWHSHAKCSTKIRMRHLDKTNKCKENEVDLWHITDEQWHDKQEIVKSMIRHKLGKSTERVYARKCEIKEITSMEAREFFDSNHIQGFAAASNYFGLFHKEELVFCMSFGKSRYNKNYDYELIRSAAKKDVSVVGGFSKVLKHFRSLNKGSIISYADKRYSCGEVYYKNGFNLIKETKPGYMWCLKSKSYSRVKFQKHKLAGILKEYNPELSERDNMFKNGFKKYWDCGQMVFVLE